MTPININNLNCKGNLNSSQLDALVTDILNFNAGRMTGKNRQIFLNFWHSIKNASDKDGLSMIRMRYKT